MTKRDDSPAILEEIKAELDPIIDEGLKWLEEHSKEETDVYKEKQKELEGKVNPLMQKLYSQGGVPTGADIYQQPGSVPEGDEDDDGDDGDDGDLKDDVKTGNKNIDELD
jgi:hypothetical protein